MKVVSEDYVKKGRGSVTMIAEESDDLWMAYKLIAKGDFVSAETVRKVIKEAAKGGEKAERMKFILEIKVETIEHDKQWSELRIHGKNVMVNEHVKIGASHTLELVLNRRFVLRKEVWDSGAIKTLHQASTKTVINLIKDPKSACQEIRALNKLLFTMTSNDPDRACYHCYGPEHVDVAHESRAIQTLFISDDLFRSADIATRHRYEKLVGSVRRSGAAAYIFSPMHFSGELAQIAGVAAILSFPLPHLEDMEM